MRYFAGVVGGPRGADERRGLQQVQKHVRQCTDQARDARLGRHLGTNEGRPPPILPNGLTAKGKELGRCQGSLGQKLTAEPWLDRFTGPGVLVPTPTGRKCRCLFQRPRQAALLALERPGPSRDGGSMSRTARLSALVYLRQRRGQPVIHTRMELGRSDTSRSTARSNPLVLVCAQEPI